MVPSQVNRCVALFSRKSRQWTVRTLALHFLNYVSSANLRHSCRSTPWYGTHGWSSPRSHTETQMGLAVLAHGIHRELATSSRLTESPASTPPTARRFLHHLHCWIWTLERQINGRRPSTIIIAYHHDMSLEIVAARLTTLAGDQTSGQGQAFDL